MSDPHRPPAPPARRPAPTVAARPASSMKAVSAARARPLPTSPHGPISGRLKSGAQDTALNVASILREMWEDFRRSDRFFKYKLFVLLGWLAISGGTIVVACPGGMGPRNTLGARLVQTKVADTPVMMIVNDSGKAWTDVIVIVNEQYRASVGKVGGSAPDNNLTLEPKKLLAEGGRFAPNDLDVRALQVRAREGVADLLVNGEAP